MKDGKLEGFSVWESEPTSFKTVLLRNQGEELAVDFEANGFKYTAIMQKAGDRKFQGIFTRMSGSKKYVGNISCKLFEDDDEVYLFGRWQEDDVSYTWYAEFQNLD